MNQPSPQRYMLVVPDGAACFFALDDGARATIVRLAEHDGDLLHWFYDQGLEPGRALQMKSADPAAGSFRVKLGRREETIGEKAAAGLFVRPS